MHTSDLLTWEDRLTRITLALLVLACVFGIFAGAVVTMYYDVIPGMSALEDRLGAVPGMLFFLAFLLSLSHLPLALADGAQKRWSQAALRAALFCGPLLVFLGTEGLISHFLWWSAISDTDRFHLLHHFLFAGAPLTLGYWLFVRRWWRPAGLEIAPGLSLWAWLISGVVLVMILLGMGVLTGMLPTPIAGGAALAGLVALPILWRAAR